VGYYLEAVIARADLLREVVGFSAELPSGGPATPGHWHIAALDQGLALLPVTEDLADEALAAARGSGASGRMPERSVLYLDCVVAQLREWSRRGRVAYVTADYFGGVGDQWAGGWSGGDLAFEPRPARGEPSPISQVLRWLGAARGAAYDEFEAVGLDRHRRTAEWVEAARDGSA